MPTVQQQMRREQGGVAGKPGAAGKSGQLAVNFQAGAGTELWAFSSGASDWVRLNPPGVAPRVLGRTAGGAAAIETQFNTDAIQVDRGDIVVYTHGGTAYIYTGAISSAPATPAVATAGDFTALGAAATYASQADVTAGTAVNEGINPLGLRAELARLFGLTAAQLLAAPATTATGGTAAQAGLIPTLNAAGVLPASALPPIQTIVTGVDITAAPAAGAAAGDAFIVGTGGAANAGYTGLTGSIPAGSFVVFDGTSYHAFADASQLNFVPLDGGVMLDTGTLKGKVTWNPQTADTVVLDGTTPANAHIDNFTLDGGVY